MTSQRSGSVLSRIRKTVKRRLRDDYYLRHYMDSPIKERLVLIEPKEGVEFAPNMFYLAKTLSEREFTSFHVCVVYAEGKKREFEQLMEKYEFGAELVARMSNRYLECLATARYLFTDSTFPYFFIKRDGQVYTNTWHGTPLKHMGRHEEKRAFALGNLMRNFTMADYLVYPNVEMQKKMMEAFSIREYGQGTILHAGYPRNSVFFQQDRADALKEELGLADKKVYAYLPTWRGTLTHRESDDLKKDITALFESIDIQLNDNQVMLAKIHPLSGFNLDVHAYRHVRAFPLGYETYDVLNCADVLITDYSSVMFDFANTGKKVVLYAYDETDYLADRGMYYKLQDFPFPVVRTPEALICELTCEKGYDDSDFKKSFCTYDCAEAPYNLAAFVLLGKNVSEVTAERIDYYRTKPKLVLCPVDSLLGISEESGIETARRAIEDAGGKMVATFIPKKEVAQHPEWVASLPNEIGLFPVCEGGFVYTASEWVLGQLNRRLHIHNNAVKNSIERQSLREVQRIYGGARFNAVFADVCDDKNMRRLLCGLHVAEAMPDNKLISGQSV